MLHRFINKQQKPVLKQFQFNFYHRLSTHHHPSPDSNHHHKPQTISRTTLPQSQSQPQPPTLVQAVIATYLPSIRSLAAKLPHLRKPPTPTDLLPLTDSFLDRLQIRFKWLTIRSFRPYRSDDYSAFASLLVLLALLLAALTTTSFLAVLLLIFNKAGLEDLVARWLSDYLSRTTGVRIHFASALVPRWRDGLIRFENVIVSRGVLSFEPEQLFREILGAHNLDTLSVGLNPFPSRPRRRHLLDRWPLHSHPDATDHGSTDDSVPEVEEDLSAILYPPSSQVNHQYSNDHPYTQSPNPSNPSNVTHFHLTIASIDVTLSLRRWLDGKGLIRQASVSGVRGVIDRSHLQSTDEQDYNSRLDRAALRRTPAAGDFHLEQLLVDDLLVTIYQPDGFRPVSFYLFTTLLSLTPPAALTFPLGRPSLPLSHAQYICSVFSADVRRLRKQWLFLDLLGAEQVTGQIDNCLFSLHRPQSLTRSNLLPQPSALNHTSPKRFETHLSRFRIDGVPIDHLQSQSDRGPLAWISSGKVDVVADISLPRELETLDLRTVVREIVDNFEKELIQPTPSRISERPDLIKPALEPPALNSFDPKSPSTTLCDDQVMIDMDIRFKDVKATVPVRYSSFQISTLHIPSNASRYFSSSAQTCHTSTTHLFDPSWPSSTLTKL